MEIAVIILAVVLILAALSMEQKLGRANRIARASHDVLKEMLELQKAGNRDARRGEFPTAIAPTFSEKKTAGDTVVATGEGKEPEVYRL